jgi:hypothetical protein
MRLIGGPVWRCGIGRTGERGRGAIRSHCPYGFASVYRCDGGPAMRPFDALERRPEPARVDEAPKGIESSAKGTDLKKDEALCEALPDGALLGASDAPSDCSCKTHRPQVSAVSSAWLIQPKRAGRSRDTASIIRFDRTNLRHALTARAAARPRNHSSASNKLVENTIKIVARAAIVGLIFSRIPVNICRGNVV